METIDPGLGGVEVRDSDGNTLHLGEAWRERVAALVFVRPFG